MKADNKSSLESISDKIKISAQFNRVYQDKYAKLLTWLPLFAVIISMLTSIMKHIAVVNATRQAVITAILTATVSYYIQLSAESILAKKYAKGIILGSYLCSFLLLLVIPKPEILSFWMIGGLVISLLIDNKLGLLIQFNMAFIMGITLDVQPKMILQNMVVCVLMCVLADALKNKTTIIYGAIIILSINITLAYVINNFIFDKIADVNYYYFSVFSIISVLVISFFVYVQYQKMVNKRELNVELQNQVFENIMTSEEETIETEKTAGMKEEENITEKTIKENTAGDKSLILKTQETNMAAGNNKVEKTFDELYTCNGQTTVLEHNIHQKKLLNSTVGEAIAENINTNSIYADTINTEDNIHTYDSKSSAYCEVLCNPDYILLKNLKEFSIDLYEHSLKIGDLSSRAAKEIGADEILAKAGGLYHEIGKINSKQYIEESIKIAKKYEFPEKLVSILREHNIKYDKPNSVEAAIVMLSDNVVSTIEYIKKTGDHRFAPSKIIENVFQMRLDKGTFDTSGISLKDYKILKEFYQKEFCMDK